MTLQATTHHLVNQIQQTLTMKERNYLCNRLRCSLKDLIIAEDSVGIDQELIVEYMKENKMI